MWSSERVDCIYSAFFNTLPSTVWKLCQTENVAINHLTSVHIKKKKSCKLIHYPNPSILSLQSHWTMPAIARRQLLYWYYNYFSFIEKWVKMQLPEANSKKATILWIFQQSHFLKYLDFFFLFSVNCAWPLHGKFLEKLSCAVSSKAPCKPAFVTLILLLRWKWIPV